MQTIKLTELNKKQAIKQTIEVLKLGGLVVFPTDTVYGLLADATNPKAIDKLLDFKQRPPGKAISVFVATKDQIKDLVIINQNAKNIITNLLPGPFTIICKAKSEIRNPKFEIDDRLLAENQTLGFRLPHYPLLNQLTLAFKHPLTATSANISSSPPHYSIEALLNSLSEKKKQLLNLIIDTGKLPKNKPSTVIDTTSGELKTLRLGDLLPATDHDFISHSQKQTLDLARFILAKAFQKFTGKPVVFLLQGDLGTGKTVFTKGLGKALKINQEIVSPTYTLSYEYPIPNTFSTEIPQLSTNSPIANSRASDTERLDQKLNLVQQVLKTPKLLIHYDLYRLETTEDLKEIFFLKSIKPPNLYSIEWPEKIDKNTLVKLKKIACVIYVRLSHLGGNKRKISWSF